jgi:hypothetical protein
MKLIILFQLLTGLVDYDSTKIVIDIQHPVEHCELYYIEDDKRYQAVNPTFQGSDITVFLKQYRDYELIINHYTVVSITLMAEELRDDRDISISCAADYTLNKGCIVFSNLDLTYK